MTLVDRQAPGNVPRKPCSDKRTYKHLVLRNGLRALLLQDQEVVFATACANVQVGYFDDPADMPGLAHYIEHMVHLGSKLYPDEKEYKHFLGQHGGASNASTGNFGISMFKISAERCA